MPARVPDLVSADGRGEHEDAPVVDVADDAAVAEDELAGCEDDSGGGVSALSASRVVGGVFEREGEVRGKGGDLLLDLGEVAGAGLVGEGVSCCLEGEGTKGGDETNNADNLVQHLGGQAVAGVLRVNRRRGLS